MRCVSVSKTKQRRLASFLFNYSLLKLGCYVSNYMQFMVFSPTTCPWKQTTPDGPPQERVLPPLPDRLAAAVGAVPPAPKPNPLLAAQLGHRDSLLRTPFVVAVEAGDAELIELLLRKGGTRQLLGKHGMEWTPIMCGYGSIVAVKTIIDTLEDMNAKGEQGEDLVGSAPAFPQHPSGPTEVMPSPVQNPDSHTMTVLPTPSTPSSQQSPIEPITAATLFAQTNEQGQTLLHLASLHGSAGVVAYLLNERRADIASDDEELWSLIRHKDTSGRTCIMLAAAGAGYGDQDQLIADRVETLRLLMAALPQDAATIRSVLLEDVNANGRNATMMAAENGNTEALALLLSLAESHGLLVDVLNAVDGLGLSMPGIAVQSRAQKPWLRPRLEAALGLLSNLSASSPGVSPGTPVPQPGAGTRPPLPPIMVANPSVAGRPATSNIETKMEELSIDSAGSGGSGASPGSAVGEQAGTADGLRRKGSGASRGSGKADE